YDPLPLFVGKTSTVLFSCLISHGIHSFVSISFQMLLLLSSFLNVCHQWKVLLSSQSNLSFSASSSGQCPT
ncbi:hypothetical protein PISMIDRAFT_635027, partial [Pisolithus microcarpus 441]